MIACPQCGRPVCEGEYVYVHRCPVVVIEPPPVVFFPIYGHTVPLGGVPK